MKRSEIRVRTMQAESSAVKCGVRALDVMGNVKVKQIRVERN